MTDDELKKFTDDFVDLINEHDENPLPLPNRIKQGDRVRIIQFMDEEVEGHVMDGYTGVVDQPPFWNQVSVLFDKETKRKMREWVKDTENRAAIFAAGIDVNIFINSQYVFYPELLEVINDEV